MTSFKNALLGALFICLATTSAYAEDVTHSAVIEAYGISFAEENDGRGQNHAVLDINYKYSTTLSKELRFDLNTALFQASYPETNFTVPEIVLSYEKNDTKISVGRLKLKNPVFIDEDWKLGLSSAYLRADPFRPQEQGLLGVFYKFKSDQVLIEFFGSPFFLPDQGPNVDVGSNGVVESSSPWTFLPPERLRLSTGADLRLRYELVQDSLPELLTEAQFGGRFEIKTKDLKLMGVYQNRPSRQLSFALDANLQADAGGVINVEGRPLFRREHFYGLQAETKWFKKLKVKNGFYGLVQQSDRSQDQARFQSANYDYFFVTTSLEYAFKSVTAKLKYLFSNRKQNIEEDVVYFETSRFLFENAFGLEFSKIKYKQFSSNFGAVFAHREKAAQIYFAGNLHISKNLLLFSRLNLIEDFSDEKGEENSDEVSLSASGFSQFAGLDNLQFGVQYVF